MGQTPAYFAQIKSQMECWSCKVICGTAHYVAMNVDNRFHFSSVIVPQIAQFDFGRGCSKTKVLSRSPVMVNPSETSTSSSKRFTSNSNGGRSRKTAEFLRSLVSGPADLSRFGHIRC